MQKKRPLEINDIVIMKEDNTPPTKWKLARVIKVHPGGDDPRGGTEIKRPTVKLCLLPNEADFDSSPGSIENQNFQRGEDFGTNSG